ncbi:hypothetical protein Adt_06423 [Abeliophyllum distichum]|uniref:Uncharacterized protein n=1 Tax=Abeliophyllum distichum TaxID=126358 RepID=A0ABD1V6W3_9LAMI
MHQDFMKRMYPNVIEPPPKLSDPDSNVVGLFPPTNPQLTAGLTPSKSVSTTQNSFQPTVALGEAPSTAALTSTCRASAGDPPVSASPLGDRSIGVQVMVPTLPAVSRRGVIRGSLQATRLYLVILVDAPTSTNSSGVQPNMEHHLKPGMECTSIENPLVHFTASTTSSL